MKKKEDQLEIRATWFSDKAKESCEVTYAYNDAKDRNTFKIGRSRILGENVALSIGCDGVVHGTFSGTFEGIGTAQPAGSDKEIQYNDDGSFAGDPGLTWDKTTDRLKATNVQLAILNDTEVPYASDGTGLIAGDSNFTYVDSTNTLEVVGTVSGTLLEAGASGITLGGVNKIAWPAGGGSPGGSSTDVQTNDGGGGFTGDSGFVYDGTRVAIAGATNTNSRLNISCDPAETLNGIRLEDGGGSGVDHYIRMDSDQKLRFRNDGTDVLILSATLVESLVTLAAPEIDLDGVARTTWPVDGSSVGDDGDIQTSDGLGGFDGDSTLTYDGTDFTVGTLTDAHLVVTPGSNTVAIKGVEDGSDDCDLTFSTTDGGTTTQRMIVDEKGNVGIGTAVDTAVLPSGTADDVTVTITPNVGTAQSTALLRIGANKAASTVGTHARIELCEDTNTDGGAMQYGFGLHQDPDPGATPWGNGNLQIIRRSNAVVDTAIATFGRNSVADSLNVHGDGGMFVGIGTSTRGGTETFGVDGDVLVDGDVTADNIFDPQYIVVNQTGDAAFTAVTTPKRMFKNPIDYGGPKDAGTFVVQESEGITYTESTGVFQFGSAGVYAIDIMCRFLNYNVQPLDLEANYGTSQYSGSFDDGGGAVALPSGTIECSRAGSVPNVDGIVEINYTTMIDVGAGATFWFYWDFQYSITAPAYHTGWSNLAGSYCNIQKIDNT